MEYASRKVRNEILKNLLNVGMSQKSMGELLNLSQQSVSKILKKLSLGLPMTEKSKGVERRLSDAELVQLPEFLKKGAEFYDFTGAYWTHARVGYVIKKEFNIVYEDRQVGRILDLIKWTRQKPQKKDAKQSLAKVEQWKNVDLPLLKKSTRRGL
jgi:transposase